MTDVARSAERVGPGGTIEATAEVGNTGGEDGTATLKLALDDDVVDTASVSDPARETRTHAFQLSPEDPGEYAVRVNDRTGGTLQVGAGTGESGGATAEPAAASGGFVSLAAVLLVIAAIVGGGAYDWRRWA